VPKGKEGLLLYEKGDERNVAFQESERTKCEDGVKEKPDPQNARRGNGFSCPAGRVEVAPDQYTILAPLRGKRKNLIQKKPVLRKKTPFYGIAAPVKRRP